MDTRDRPSSGGAIDRARVVLTALVSLVLSLPRVASAQTCEDGLACELESRNDRGRIEIGIGGEVPLLTGFDLEFLDGDHHVRTIAVGVLPDRPSRFQLQLVDDGGDKPIRGWARYFRYEQVLRAMRERTATSTDSPVLNLRFATRRACRGSCTVTIPGLDKTRYQLFLSGFRFTFHGGDHHLRTIRIWPFGEAAGPAEVATTFRDNSEDRLYDVTLSYVLLPSEHAVDAVLYGGSRLSTDEAGTIHFPERSASGRALQGLGASYPNDEHVLRIGARVDRSGASVTLRDNDAREDIFPYLASRRLPVD